MKVFLAVNFGYEGWSLYEYPSFEEALKAVQYEGKTCGEEWKILKEITTTQKGGTNGKENN